MQTESRKWTGRFPLKPDKKPKSCAIDPMTPIEVMSAKSMWERARIPMMKLKRRSGEVGVWNQGTELESRAAIGRAKTIVK